MITNNTIDGWVKEIESGKLTHQILGNIIFIFWIIFISFYSSRVMGKILSLFIHRFVKDYYIDISSISISALSGKLMLGHVVIICNDFTFRCHDITIIFKYWNAFSPGVKSEEQDRCLHIYLFGVECHLYNQTKAYDDLKTLFASQLPRAPPPPNKKRWFRRGGSKLVVLEPIGAESNVGSTGPAAAVEDDEPDIIRRIVPEFNDAGTWNWRDLFPVIKVDVKAGKLCFGNHLLPNAFAVTCDKGHIIYAASEATYRFDRFQHFMQFDYTRLEGTLTPIVKYSGFYPLEPPPRNFGNGFQVFHFGKGKIKYYMDEPGLVSLEPEQVQMSEGMVSVCRTFPKWSIDIKVEKDFRLNYGPWADRQREILWKFFFPASFQPMQVTPDPEVGSYRLHKKLKITLQADTPAQIQIIFCKNGITQVTHIQADPGSYFTTSIPWLVEETGYVTLIGGLLLNASMNPTHVCRNLFNCEILDLNFQIHYPRLWNAHQTWKLNFELKKGRVNIVYDFKHFFKAMIDEWTEGSRPDILSFVPYTYEFRVKGVEFELVTMANDYNWIATNQENAHISFVLQDVSFDFDLPFIDFVPNTVPIVFKIEGEGLKARISLPETSTSLYTLLELHSHLRLVDKKGRPIPSNTIFRSEEEIIYVDKKTDKRQCRHWLECWDAPQVSLKISYDYHPAPHVESSWRFLARQYRPSATGEARHNKGYPPRTASRKMPKVPKLLSEESILGNLRPEGSNENGPSPSYLRRVGFDPGYMEPDMIEVDIQIPSSTVCLFGPLLRHFLHVKENYFGSFQDPVNFESGVVTADISSTTTDDSTTKTVDPRYYRPFSVRLNLGLHNIQAHLLKHCSSTGTTCPTAFVECIGFELNKRYDQTLLQVLVSPVVILVQDNCRDRPLDSQKLSEGALVVQGVQVRGHAMFSHEDLPLDNETLEYAWLVELTVGTITGQLSAVQMATIVQCVQTFVFLVADQENELVPSRDFELCQHGYPQSLCPKWQTASRNKTCPCPTEADLKYKLVRISVDGVDVYFVETGAALQLSVDPLRIATCSLHGPTNKQAITGALPRVSLMQYVRSSSRGEVPNCWLEAGSLSLGPILVNAGIALPLPEFRRWQDNFLRRHDKATKRLWFIWQEKLNDKNVGEIARKCGCFGGCAFFGNNDSGRHFMRECSPPCATSTSPSDSAAGGESEASSAALGRSNKSLERIYYPRLALLPQPDALTEGKRSDGILFGESVLADGKMLIDLHDCRVCCEETSGMFLLREKRFWPAFSLYKQYASGESPSRGSLHSMTDPLMPRDDSSLENSLLYPPQAPLSNPTTALSSNTNDELTQKSPLHPQDTRIEIGVDDDDDEGGEIPPTQSVHKRYISLHSLISDSPSSTSSDSFLQEPPLDQPPDMTKGRESGKVSGNPEVSSLGANKPPTTTTTSSGQSEHPEEDWEDMMAKYVDLRSQLSSHITESSLLRSAYERHLSRFDCGSWAAGMRLKTRWNRAMALTNPLFTSAKEGFSPRSMVERAKRGPQIAEFHQDRLDDMDSAASKEGNANPGKDTLSSTMDSSARSTATVRLQGSVDFLLTPLLLECIQRYIEVLTPELGYMHPSAVVDGLHMHCVQSTRDKSKPIPQTATLAGQDKSRTTTGPFQDSEPRSRPPPSHPAPRLDPSIVTDSEDASSKVDRRSSQIEDFLKKFDSTSKSDAALHNKPGDHSSNDAINTHDVIHEKQDKIPEEEDEDSSSEPSSSSDTGDSKPGLPSTSSGDGGLEDKAERRWRLKEGTSNGSRHGTFNTALDDTEEGPRVTRTQLAVCVERINLCCLQLSAVEDLVHSDTISSGLHDLTCVSLLAFSLDGASFQVLINQKREAIVDMDTFNRERLREHRERQRTLRQHRRRLAAAAKASTLLPPGASGDQPRNFNDAGSTSTPRQGTTDSVPLPPKRQNAPAAQQRSSTRRHETPLSFVASAPSSDSDVDLGGDTQQSSGFKVKQGGVKAEAGLVGEDKVEALRHLLQGAEDEEEVEGGEEGDLESGDESDWSVEDKSEMRRTEEMISNMEIHRIHVQLRRLTRESHFSSEVLLTAIPFNQSKVLFCFESDPVDQVTAQGMGGLGSQGRLEERSAGWIMFECGLERFTLTCVRRRGFTEGVDDYAKASETKEQMVKMETETSGKARGGGKSKESKPSTHHTHSQPKQSGDQQQQQQKKTAADEIPDLTADEDEERKRNSFLSRMHVKNVWLNFAAPKRLPNKRRIDITRYDWNLLSTATPMIKAWMNPSDRLISASQQLKHCIDRRTLSVTACLMTQAISQESDNTLDDRFNINKITRGEKALIFYDTWRTPSSRALRYEPTCQIFTVLRRYMRQRPERVIEVERWLHEDTLPPTVTLQRGILALTRDWRYFVDLYHHLPRPGTTVEAGMGKSKGMETVGGFGQETGLHHAATATNLMSAAGALITEVGPPAIVSDEETGSVNNRLGSDDGNMTGDPVTGMEDMSVENPILKRFLQDANKPYADTNENLYAWCARQQQSSSLERDRLHSTTPIGETDIPVIPGDPVGRVSSAAMTSQFKQAVHLRAQFQYMEDAQKLFRPLLEAVGLHVKGIRRTTLMKKFGGFFAADGMLESFQVDIVQSEGNPLKYATYTPAPPPRLHHPHPVHHQSSFRHGDGGVEICQSAFLCQRFASKITMRDIIGFESHSTAKIKKEQTPDMSQVDIKPTTTQVNMLLHIDHIIQHVNMPLLRLVHQFVTMIYCARDTREELEKKRNLYEVDFFKQHRKTDSKGSSNGTDTTGSTLKSKYSAQVRQGEETPSSGEVPASNTGGHGSGNAARHHGVTFGLGPSAKSSPMMLPPGVVDVASDSMYPSEGVRRGGEGTRDDTPQCWRRLYNLVELCATVPETKTVIRKPNPQTHLPPIEDEEATGHGSNSGQGHKSGPSALIAGQKKGHKRSLSAGGQSRAFHSEDVELGLKTPSTPTGTGPLHSATSPLFNPSPMSNQETSFQSNQQPAQTFGQPTTEDQPQSTTNQWGPSERSAVMQRFTYQWFHGERIPIVLFASAKVRKMDMAAVLSELKLNAEMLNIHGSFTHMTRLRGRGNFTEKTSEHSLSAHCGESEISLQEGAPPDCMEVVVVRGNRSNFLLSCERTKKAEKNSAVVRIGRIDVSVPHHPVKLHDMMQRNAKRLSSTMSEFMRSAPTSQRPRAPETIPEEAFYFHGLQKTKIEPSRPLVVNLTAVAQGLIVSVALHPTLDAVYQIDPVYLVGKIGTNGHVDFSMGGHSLSLKSSCPPVGFAAPMNIRLPHLLLSVTHRYADAGAYLPNQNKLTEGLTHEDGRYIDAYATISTLEETLTTDQLNYIMVVVKLFMKEINEVIQKMAGEEQIKLNQPADQEEGVGGGLNDSRLLSRAARGDTMFTFRVRMLGIRLTATTHMGAVKLELLEMDVELSNRVLAAGVAQKDAKSKQKHKHKSKSLPRQQASMANSSDSLFFFGKVGSINVELGLLDQDLLYNERNPEFKTLAFFKTTLALRNLLADEMSATHQGARDAFLISLIRPIVWVKPSAFDRALLLWMLYKNEFEKWNDQMRMLGSQIQTPTTGRTIPGVAYRARVNAQSHHSQQTQPPAHPQTPVNTLFLQLNVEDFGICLPTGMLHGQSLEVDSRTSIVLTLDSSRVSACFRGALVSEGEFSGFCLRFDDEFNMGLDDWKANRDRSIIQIGNEERLVVMNACVVPKGTFKVCSKTVDEMQKGAKAKMNLNVVWKMCGLDVHLDTNISRRLKVLFETLTSMTGSGQEDEETAGGFATPPTSHMHRSDLHQSDKMTDYAYRLGSLREIGEEQYEINKLQLERHHFHMQQAKSYKRSKWTSFLKKNPAPPIGGKLVKRASISSASYKSRYPGSYETMPSRHQRSVSAIAPQHALDEALSEEPISDLPSTRTHSEDEEDRDNWDDPMTSTPPSIRSFDPPGVKRPTSLAVAPCSPPSSRPPVVPPRAAPSEHTSSSGGGSSLAHHKFTRSNSVYYDANEESGDGHEGSDDAQDFEEAEGADQVWDSDEHLGGGHEKGEQGGEEGGSEPSVDLKLDINIHVDSGNCVLHPKLASKVHHTGDDRQMGGGKMPTDRTTGQFSEDQLLGLLHRYKLHLTQSQKSTDITVFYLPAVDVKLHYNSKTEQDSVSPTTTINASGTLPQRNKKKRADLYASCSLQKLPKDAIVNPSLLDFLEQTFENVSLFPEWKSDTPDASDHESSGSLLHSRADESFPVDVVVHIHVQPSTLVFTCLPTSQVQCLMSLPFLDLVFSTKRNRIELESAAAGPDGSATGTAGAKATRASLSRSLLRYKTLRRTISATGEPLSEGGLCVSAVLKEFSICVFHPYGTNRDESMWDSGRSNALGLLVQNIRVNISRTRQTTIVSGIQVHSTSGDTGSEGGTLPPPPQNASHKQVDSLSLNNNVRFSGVCDIGCAKFKYDTRRTLEILAIPNAWYRSKLARRLFLGEETGMMGGDDFPSGDASNHPPTSPPSTSSTTDFSQATPTGAGPPFVPPRPTHHRRLSSGDKLLKQRFPKSVTAPRQPSTPPEPLPSGVTDNRGAFLFGTTRDDTTLPDRKSGLGLGSGGGPGSTLPGGQTRRGQQDAGTEKAGESGGGSLGVASWQTLLIFCTNLKQLEVEMYMGSAMGITKLNVDQLYCSGRAMMDSAKRKNTNISVGLHSLDFSGEGGIVGGQLSISEVNSHVHIYENPQADPEHGFETNLRGLELRLEYMTTNILFGRVSNVEVSLHDEWRLREPSVPSSATPGRTPGSSNGASPSSSVGAESEASGRSSGTSGASMVIVVVGEMNWDQLQMAIARTTTPDLVKSVNKVKDYYLEQIREGRRSLINTNNDWMAITNSATRGSDPFHKATSDKEADAKEFINKIYQRHWQDPFTLAAASYMRLINSTKKARQATGTGRTPEVAFILGGSLQLTGHSLGVACFSGNFRSAPDWAVFNVQHPTVCFETEAQRAQETKGKQVHIRQVLSFDLGQHLQNRPQMAYVIKAKRGRDTPGKNPIAPTIAEWFEFAFKAADQSVVAFVKHNEPQLLPDIVHLTKFPDVFLNREKRANPLRVPTEAEILFVVPSISLRLTTDHVQDMEMPKSTSPPPPPHDTDASTPETAEAPDSSKETSYKVQMSFQTDFHGILHLGLIDVPWLPTLIRSYINEKIQEDNDIPDPALSERASTGSPIVRDMREYAIVHWDLSPKCRWLLANNVGVPAFDKILENIGFRKARTTIPKWLQRGIMDQLDIVLALLVERVLQLMQESEDDEEEEEQAMARLEERRSSVLTFGALPRPHVGNKSRDFP